MNRFLKNLKWVISSQLLVLIASLLRSLLIPKVLSVNGFGYWQIYLFYLSYVGIFSLGYNEGIYLAYGSYDYDDLPKKELRDGNIFHLIILVLFSILVELAVIIFYFFNKNGNYFFVYTVTALSIITYGINGVLIYIYQITNQMRSYSFFSVFSKILFSFVVLFSFFSNKLTYQNFVIADFVFTLITIILMVLKTRELYSAKSGLSLKNGAMFFWHNIKSGAMLMFAQLSSMLILGIGRLFLQLYASLREFSIFSFGITITNLLVVLSSAIGTVLYPTVARASKDKYYTIYNIINYLFETFLCIIPLIYVVAVFIVYSFLPHFTDVFSYLLLLFIIIYLQIKMQISLNTFLKALRQEAFLFRINILAIVIEFVVFLPFIYWKFDGFIVSIITVVVMLAKNYISEVFLNKLMISNSKDRKFAISLFESFSLFVLIILNTIMNKTVIIVVSLIYTLIFVRKLLKVIKLGKKFRNI